MQSKSGGPIIWDTREGKRKLVFTERGMQYKHQCVAATLQVPGEPAMEYNAVWLKI